MKSHETMCEKSKYFSNTGAPIELRGRSEEGMYLKICHVNFINIKTRLILFHFFSSVNVS